MKYTKENLFETIIKNNDEEVVRKTWELGKDRFDEIDLVAICNFCKTENIVKKAFDLGKDRFDKHDLMLICSFCKTENIVKKAFELGKGKFDKGYLSVICAFCRFESIAKEAKRKLEDLEELNERTTIKMKEEKQWD